MSRDPNVPDPLAADAVRDGIAEALADVAAGRVIDADALQKLISGGHVPVPLSTCLHCGADVDRPGELPAFQKATDETTQGARAASSKIMAVPGFPRLSSLLSEELECRANMGWMAGDSKLRELTLEVSTLADLMRTYAQREAS